MKKVLQIFRAAFQDWREDSAARLAAALAFYTVLSLAPLLLSIVGVLGLVYGDEAARGELATVLQRHMGRENAEFLQGVMQRGGKEASGLAAVVGFVLLLFGASGIFLQLQDGLNTIWEVKPKPGRGLRSTIVQRLWSFAMVLGVALVLLVAMVASAVLGAVGDEVSGSVPGGALVLRSAQVVASIAVLTVLFALVFKVLPDVRVAWRDVWIGASVTAVLFTACKVLIGLYVGHSSTASAYGAAGALVALLVWIWLSAQVFYFGAEFTQAQARLSGHVIEPDRNAVRLTCSRQVPQESSGPTRRPTIHTRRRRVVVSRSNARRAGAPPRGKAAAALTGAVVGYLMGHLVGRKA